MNPKILSLLDQSMSLLQANDDYSAELLLNQIIKLEPNNADALHFLGIIEVKRKKFDSALLYFQKVLKVSPHHVYANSNVGNVLIELKRYNEALIYFDRVIAIDPDYVDAYCNKGNALKALGRYEDALTSYDKAIANDSKHVEAFYNKGSVLHELGHFEDALRQFNIALGIEPDNCEVYSSKGAAHHELLQYEEALIACDKAIAINSKYAQVYLNKCVTLQALRRYPEALENLNKAIEVDGDYADAHFIAGILQLKMGQFQSGWDGWEWRWLSSNFNSVKYLTSKPEWNGQKTQQRVMVWPEQGIGDQVLYSSMFHEVDALCQKVIVPIEARLLPIFRRSFPNLEFVDSRIPISADAYDLQIPMGSLMRCLRLSKDCFLKAKFPYLLDDKERTAFIRGSYKQEAPNKIVCGLSWRTSNPLVAKYRSIPLNKMASLLNLEQYQFINLQYGNIVPDLQCLPDKDAHKIQQISGVNLFDDLEGVLSLIQTCDLIVTCDNYVVHMAGALNKRVILIVPYEIGRFWYWSEMGAGSLCYPSVEIFSQTKQGSWDEVIEQVKSYMQSLSLE